MNIQEIKVTVVRKSSVKSEDCDHNEMIENNEPGFVWKCSKCGYVYGKNK